MPRGNVVSFNLIVDANSRDGQPDASLWRPSSARAAPPASRPPNGSRTRRLAGCMREGKAVHALAVLEGLAAGVFVSKTPARSSLVSMYARCGDMGEVRGVFDASEERVFALSL
jgi:hypothetical protein